MVEMVKDIVIKKTEEIKPYWRNPRRNEATVSALMEIIPKVGFNVPILIDNDNVIVKGHARYAACVRLGIKEIPCIVSKNTEEQNKLDRLADNKISELAEWDTSELRYELEQLSVDVDLKTIGFELDFDNELFRMDFQTCDTNSLYEQIENLKIVLSPNEKYSSVFYPYGGFYFYGCHPKHIEPCICCAQFEQKDLRIKSYTYSSLLNKNIDVIQSNPLNN